MKDAPPERRGILAALRVLYMGDTLNVGGTENQMVQVARRLKRRGAYIRVGCLGARGSLLRALQDEEIPVTEFPVHGGLTRPQGLLGLLDLSRFIRSHRFDVVHTHDLWSNLIGVPAAFLARAPVIVSSRRDLANWWWYTPNRRRVLRWIQRLSHIVVANSEAVREMLVRDDGFDPARVRVVRNGVDSISFEQASADRSALIPGATKDDKLVAVLANMNDIDKGHSLVIEAASGICPLRPEIRFVLIGDGRQRPKLQDRIRTLGLEHHFLFLGGRNDVPELLSCCDFSLLASSAEGLPNAVLESMAAGLPVIATAVGGTPEIIEDGEHGLLVPPRDPDAIGRALRRLVEDEALSRKLRTAGRERVRKSFSFERVLADLEEVYGSLMRAKLTPF